MDQVDHNSDDFDAAVSEALGEEPRASELEEMHAALSERRVRLVHDLDTAEDGVLRDKLRRELTKLDEQIQVLREEANITKFVEDTVRVNLEMRRLSSS